MTILVHTPYGSSHRENGLIYLFVNYLRTIGLEPCQIGCNGVFSLCDRDEETGWRRTLDSCVNCSFNQRSLASWSGASTLDLSQFLSPQEVVFTRRVINEMPVSSLKNMSFGGISIYDLCIDSFRLRIGNAVPDFNNKKQEQLMRRYMLSAVRMSIAAKKIIQKQRPEFTLLASGQDFITRAYLEQARKQSSRVALFKMDLHERAIKIIDSESGKNFSCPLLMTDVLNMRADVNTWPKEMLNMMYKIAEFLDVSDPQISLPLAQ